MGGGTKDLALYIEEAKAQGLPSSVVEDVASLWEYAVDRIGGSKDFTSLIRCFEEWTGIEVAAEQHMDNESKTLRGAGINGSSLEIKFAM